MNRSRNRPGAMGAHGSAEWRLVRCPPVALSGIKGMFVPGLCCRSDIWEEASARLPGVDVVALDWPWPERLGSYDDGAAWLADEIRAHRPHFVVGHSFGGVLALHLCSQMQPRPEWHLVLAGVPTSAGQDVRAVPGTSHFPMLERPEEFYATLRDVLKIKSSPL